MASRPQTKPAQRPAPALYLVTPPVETATGFADKLAAAVAAAEVLAVLMCLTAPDERGKINAVKALAPVAQGRGVAVLIDGSPELVARAGADGAHLTGIAALQAALPVLKPDRIAGAGGLLTRHDAMLAGEAGADYVMFGEPDARGHRPHFDLVQERVAWWAELFEPSCAAFAANLDEVGALAAAGADFVTLGDWVWRAPDGTAATVAEAWRRLGRKEVVA
jgi:thiamine-phosphate pyrophosphorylase